MRLGYTLFYVNDVEWTMSFYSKAFGLDVSFLHDSKQYGEMATGETKLGFVHHDTAMSHGFSYNKMDLSQKPAAFEIGFVTKDVPSAFEKATQNGATVMRKPEVTPWGQTVAYVRDCNGYLVEICSPIG